MYRGDDGQIAYRCPAEPLSVYLAKGGKAEDAEGRKCLCNALMANIGHQQIRCGHHVEPPLVTAGDDLTEVARFLPAGSSSYGVADVLDALLPREVTSTCFTGCSAASRDRRLIAATSRDLEI
jgi:nitronate monooxygenase